MNLIRSLPAYDEHSGLLQVVVEAPKGTSHKFKYDPRYELFRLSKIVPAGSYFPFFGFVPSTAAEDGDPLDVLVLTDEPAVVGTLLPVRLLGVLEAEQVAAVGSELKADEAATRGLRRLARKRTQRAIENLNASSRSPSEAVHHARKRLKKIRALVRLAQAALRSKNYCP